MRVTRSVKVFAPATVANVACGFDVLGFAVEAPGDTVTVALSNKTGIRINKITGDGGQLPLIPHKNTASVAVQAYLQYLDIQGQGIEITIEKNLPLGSGMGSSAASAAAAVVAVNELFDNPLTRAELVPFAMEAERVACGSAHADNVAPAIMGGFVLIRSYMPLDLIPISPPKDLYCTIVMPHIELRTEDARKILKQEISLKEGILQWGNLAGLIAGLMKNDYALIGRSLQDVIIEPMRALLIPGFDEAKKAALQSGVLGCSISGSGPSIFALSASRNTAQVAAEAMQQALGKIGLKSQIYVSPVNETGAVVVENDKN
jgi:homoserine kinase